MRISIALKINLILVVVVLSLGSSAGLLFYVFQKELLTESLDRRVQLIGSYLSQSIEYPLSNNDIKTVDLHLQAAGLDREIAYVMVKSTEGEIKAARWVSQTSGDISEYGFTLHTVTKPVDSHHVVPFGTVSSSTGSPSGQLSIGVDLTSQDAALARLLWGTVTSIVIAGAVALLVGLLFVRQLLQRSFVPLVEGIHMLGSGDLTYRFRTDNEDEIGEIGKRFNDMSIRLSETLVSKQELESVVAERTAELMTALEERIETQNSLKEREEHIRLLLNSTAEAIYGIDTNGICTFCNPACIRMLGYEKEEDLLGRNMHDQIHHSRNDGSPYPVVDCLIFKAFRSSTPCHTDAEVLWKADGTCMHVEYWSYPVFKDNKVVGAVVTFVDISERILLTDQLIQAQKMESIGRLAGGVAHDFNNLLTPIIGYADFLKNDIPANSPATGKVEHILKAAERAKELVRQLLSFSRKQIMEMKTLDLNRVIENLYPMLRRTIREDIDIRLCLADEKHGIRADAHQIEQIIMNLAVNSQDAIQNKGLITIEAAAVLLDDEYASHHTEIEAGQYLMLAVSDNGIGMNHETRQRIFEPFFTTKGVGKGTGLGLATVYGIVRQHGGTIWVYSEPDKGTTFKIYFPIADTLPMGELSDTERTISLAGRNRSVLVVEDNQMVRELVSEMLTRHGFTVIAAEGGHEALKMAAGHPLDLLVADVVMPEMTGPELYKRILSDYPGLKVLYMSGYTNNAIVHHGVLDEGIHFIQKPFAMTEFARKIETLLES